MVTLYLLSIWLLLWMGCVTALPNPITYNLQYVANCPCSNPKWCEPITEMGRKEQFAFSVKNDDKYWNLYDWSKLTTIATADYVNISLVCLAHSHNTRVIYMSKVDEKTFMSPELRSQWVEDQLVIVRQNYLDGLNFDYEGAIGPTELTKRDAYTALVKETREKLKQEFPYSLVAVDVGWRPGVDERYYDYPNLASYSDFLLLMAYDEQSQIYGECIAGPNCPLNPTADGIKQFMSLNNHKIESNKLVLGIPWFGISYECLRTFNENCYIKKIPYRGAPCSDSPGQPYDYKDIHKLHLDLPDKYKWNTSSSTPYIMYTNSSTGKTYQVQYDNVRSLKTKYDLVSTFNLRGIGIFTIDMLDYTNTPQGAAMRTDMFDALPTIAVTTGNRIVGRNPLTKARPGCPCRNQSLCEPIKTTGKREVLGFSSHNDETHWLLYDWSKLTTVVMFNYINTSLVCLAHSHGARVVLAASSKTIQNVLLNPKLRSKWVAEQIQLVYDNYLDGLNIDYESPVSPSQKHLRNSYTALVQETSKKLRAMMPHTQISISTIDYETSTYRAYDYPSLAKAADFFFIMAYDENVWMVGPNSDFRTAKTAIKSFLKAKIPASKLMLGLPWYGDVYKCDRLEGDKCVTGSGKPHINQVCYSGIMDTLDEFETQLEWNKTSDTPYFSFTSHSTAYQAQFDNPKSLYLKYQLAKHTGIRGVGIWHLDCLNYSHSTQAQKMRDAMFNALPKWKV